MLAEHGPAMLADLARRSAAAPEDWRLRLELARTREELGQEEAAASARSEARLALEGELGGAPGAHSHALDPLLELLAREVSERAETIWSPLRVLSAESEEGAVLTPRFDHSLLAGGENPPSDRYRLGLECDLPEIVALRLEALTDPSLPNRGPGRAANGVFALVNWELRSGSADAPGELAPLLLHDAVADHPSERFPIRPRGWNITGATGVPRTAVFAAGPSEASESGHRLEVEMQFQRSEAYADQNLGCFRLSASSWPGALEWSRLRFDFEDAGHPPLARLALAYALLGEGEKAGASFAAALEAAGDEEASERIAAWAAAARDMEPPPSAPGSSEESERP